MTGGREGGGILRHREHFAASGSHGQCCHNPRIFPVGLLNNHYGFEMPWTNNNDTLAVGHDPKFFNERDTAVSKATTLLLRRRTGCLPPGAVCPYFSYKIWVRLGMYIRVERSTHRLIVVRQVRDREIFVSSSGSHSYYSKLMVVGHDLSRFTSRGWDFQTAIIAS